MTARVGDKESEGSRVVVCAVVLSCRSIDKWDLVCKQKTGQEYNVTFVGSLQVIPSSLPASKLL